MAPLLRNAVGRLAEFDGWVEENFLRESESGSPQSRRPQPGRTDEGGDGDQPCGPEPLTPRAGWASQLHRERDILRCIQKSVEEWETSAENLRRQIQSVVSDVDAVRSELTAMGKALNGQVLQKLAEGGAAEQKDLQGAVQMLADNIAQSNARGGEAMEEWLKTNMREVTVAMRKDRDSTFMCLAQLQRRIEGLEVMRLNGCDEPQSLQSIVQGLSNKIDAEGAARKVDISDFRSEVDDWLKKNMGEMKISLFKKTDTDAITATCLEHLKEQVVSGGGEAAAVQGLSEKIDAESAARKADISDFRSEVDDWLKKNIEEVKIALFNKTDTDAIAATCLEHLKEQLVSGGGEAGAVLGLSDKIDAESAARKADISDFRSEVDDWLKKNVDEIKMALVKKADTDAIAATCLMHLKEQMVSGGGEAAAVQGLSDKIDAESAARKADISIFRTEVDDWLKKNIDELKLALQKTSSKG